MAVGLDVGIVLIVVGLILIGAEFLHPGALILVPGTLLLASGLLYVFLPDILLASVWGPLLVAAAAIVAALLTIPYYQRIAPVHRPMTTIPTSLAGEVGVVTVAVQPDNMRGKVRVGSEIWSAVAGVPIPVGRRVRVLGGEGVSIRVQEMEGGGPT